MHTMQFSYINTGITVVNAVISISVNICIGVVVKAMEMHFLPIAVNCVDKL